MTTVTDEVVEVRRLVNLHLSATTVNTRNAVSIVARYQTIPFSPVRPSQTSTSIDKPS